MKRAVIVHCWGGMPTYCWYPWVRAQLEDKGFEVSVPAMPDTDAPNLQTWLPALQSAIGTPDDELYLIGHSIGCATIMRYLEQLPEEQKIGGAVLVAGFTDNLGFDELVTFYRKPLDLARIKEHAKHGFYNIHSDDDPYVPVANSKRLQKGLGGEAIVLHAKGHFSGPVDDETSCTELPEVIKAVKKLSSWPMTLLQ